jgi:ATP-dependent Lhr-like helicase
VSNKTEDLFLRANYTRLFAIFDTGPMYNVVDGKKIVGTLDSEFVRFQQMPFVFVLGGLEWDAIKIDHETQQITVKKNETGIAPKWTTINSFDVPFELAQEIGRLLMSDERLDFLDQTAHKIIDAKRAEFGAIDWTTEKWIMEMALDAGKVYLWTFAGDKINRSLQTILKHKLGSDISYDYKSIVIENKNSRSADEIYDLIMRLDAQTEADLLQMIEGCIKPKWFSKFSECLPAELSKRTIIEKGMDLSGLLRELNIVTIDY